MNFLLEYWEKKTVTVTAENFSAAVQQVPSSRTFESVRKVGDDYEDRLTEYDWCHLCSQPLLGDKDGPVDRWVTIKLDHEDDKHFLASEVVHETCAENIGRTIIERMRS